LAKEARSSKQRLTLLNEADRAFQLAIGDESVTSSPDFYAELMCASAEPLVERARAAEDAEAAKLLQEAVRRVRRAIDMTDAETSPAHYAEAQWMLGNALIVMEQRGVPRPKGLAVSGDAPAKAAISAFREAGFVAEAARRRSDLRRLVAPSQKRTAIA
jgi:hypothetical protein